MKGKLLVAYISFVFTTAFSQSTESIRIGNSYSFHSVELDEDRTLLIHCSEYSSKENPTVYVLDGHDHFRYLVGMFHRMGGDFIPKMNVVAITQNDRRKDLNPDGYDRFFAYVKNEVIPFSDSICGKPSERILIGHSMAGLFAMNAFINDQSTFDRYLAIDPYMVGQEISEKVQNISDNSDHWDKSIYISIARTFPDSLSFNEMKSDTSKRTEMAREILALSNVFDSKGESFHFDYQYFDKESHMSVPNITMYHGIRFFFEGYRPEEE